MTKITSSPSVRHGGRYRLWMAPLLAAISESLTPGWLQDLGGSLCGERPRYKSGFAAAPTSQHFVTLSDSF